MNFTRSSRIGLAWSTMIDIFEVFKLFSRYCAQYNIDPSTFRVVFEPTGGQLTGVERLSAAITHDINNTQALNPPLDHPFIGGFMCGVQYQINGTYHHRKA